MRFYGLLPFGMDFIGKSELLSRFGTPNSSVSPN